MDDPAIYPAHEERIPAKVTFLGDWGHTTKQEQVQQGQPWNCLKESDGATAIGRLGRRPDTV